MLASPLAAGVLRRARERGVVEVLLHQLRDYASGRHLEVDDAPYGGGPGMVMRPEPLVAAIEHVAAADRPRRILLSPRGVPFSDARARALAREPALLLICPRYEGVDERVTAYVDEELSIGDYVLTGGETAALVVMDAVVRLLPGAVGNQASPGDSRARTTCAHSTSRRRYRRCAAWSSASCATGTRGRARPTTTRAGRRSRWRGSPPTSTR